MPRGAQVTIAPETTVIYCIHPALTSDMLPTSELIHAVDLTLPNLSAAMEGLRIAHLSDLHVTQPKLRDRHQHLVRHLGRLRIDLAVLTGDYISDPGQEEAAYRVMAAICEQLRPRLGTFGVFGNHDSADLRERFTHLPVTWLHNAVYCLADVPIDIIGLSEDRTAGPDAVRAVMTWPDGEADRGPRLRLMLSHRPSFLPTAADLNVQLMFAGHTHGGQMRLPFKRALRNSSDFPLRLTSGILRHRDTLCVVSRGLGEVTLPMRLFCPPHLPLYTLRRGPLFGQRTDQIVNVHPW